MKKNEFGNYNYKGWLITPEHQDVNGRRMRKGLWLLYGPTYPRNKEHGAAGGSLRTAILAINEIIAGTC